MILCIAEKPSVGREIARILGADNRRDGYYEGNGYYISWTFGHLCTLKEPDDYSPDWKRWSMEYLPMIPPKFQLKVIPNSGVEKQFQTLKHLVEQCSEVVNCGDAGQEGELIQRWVLTKAGNQKPVKRLWISSLTDEAIKEGFQTLKRSEDYDRLYAAGNARAIGDWLLGMNASRLYTIKYANGRGVLSIGRVQTPTLALIVNRHLEIEHFKPETYWELKTNYRSVIFNSTQRKFTKKEEAEKILEVIKNKLFEIVSVTKKNGNEGSPPLFDLTSLQVECNKKYSFTADDTLKYIQKLYELKLVTYPRVDTTYLPENMYEKIPGILSDLKPYATYTVPLLQKPIKKSKKVFDDKKITDHHAIIPTGVLPPGSLMLQEKQVYDTITRRFISVFYPDCVVSNTSVMGKVDEHEFSASGKVILEEGWRILYPKKEQNEDKKENEDQEMPIFTKGEKGEHQPDLLEKQTQPPKPHTEATLLRAMETAGKQVDDPELRDLMKENGIGRPSTRANIIETLFKRHYITRQRKNIIPTETGVQLIQTIQNELLKSVELTGLWERKLRQIEKGEYDPMLFMQEMKQMVSDLVAEVKKENGSAIYIDKPKEDAKPKTVSSTDEPVKKEKSRKDSKLPSAQKSSVCPVCKKGQIIKGHSAYGCSEYKNGCGFRVNFELFSKKLNDKQLSNLIQKGKTPLIKGLVHQNEKVNGVIILNAQGIPEIQIQKETTENKKQMAKADDIIGKPCPKCTFGSVIKGRTAYGCSRYKEGCDYLQPF